MKAERKNQGVCGGHTTIVLLDIGGPCCLHGGRRADSDESFVQFLINQMTTIDLSNNDDILLNNKYVNKHITL